MYQINRWRERERVRATVAAVQTGEMVLSHPVTVLVLLSQCPLCETL